MIAEILRTRAMQGTLPHPIGWEARKLGGQLIKTSNWRIWEFRDGSWLAMRGTAKKALYAHGWQGERRPNESR